MATTHDRNVWTVAIITDNEKAVYRTMVTDLGTTGTMVVRPGKPCGVMLIAAFVPAQMGEQATTCSSSRTLDRLSVVVVI
jgi:hypothetical protein